jgi:hypothetical protein
MRSILETNQNSSPRGSASGLNSCRRRANWSGELEASDWQRLDFVEDMAECPSVPYVSDLLSVNVMRTDPTRNASIGRE